jgi:hypothetical protein
MREPEDVLRDAVERVDELMAAPGAPAALREPWDQVRAALALGPRPERRDCPFCGRPGMRAATRCGYCWRALQPPADDPGQRAAPGEGSSR